MHYYYVHWGERITSHSHFSHPLCYIFLLHITRLIYKWTEWGWKPFGHQLMNDRACTSPPFTRSLISSYGSLLAATFISHIRSPNAIIAAETGNVSVPWASRHWKSRMNTCMYKAGYVHGHRLIHSDIKEKNMEFKSFFLFCPVKAYRFAAEWGKAWGRCDKGFFLVKGHEKVLFTIYCKKPEVEPPNDKRTAVRKQIWR